jgi:hypothetical protein
MDTAELKLYMIRAIDQLPESLLIALQNTIASYQVN